MPLLREQTADFADHRARYGLPVTYDEIAGGRSLQHHGRDGIALWPHHHADPAIARADGL